MLNKHTKNEVLACFISNSIIGELFWWKTYNNQSLYILVVQYRKVQPN